MKKGTKKSTRVGRIALKMKKGTDLKIQASEGNRDRHAYHAMVFLNMISRRSIPVKKTGTVVDWLMPMLVKAWNSNDVKFFQSIADTVKRNNQKHHPNKVVADAEANKLFGYLLETPKEFLESNVFSIPEIQQITGASYTTARRLARAAGMRTRGRGVH